MSLTHGLRRLRRNMPADQNRPRLVFSTTAILLLVASPFLVAAGSLREKAAEACLVRTIETSAFSPPSPDPAGIVYIRETDTFLIADSEVNEMPAFAGVNVFGMSLSGNLASGFDTVTFSTEPTGVTYNPSNMHLFFSDDDSFRVYEVDPGNDGEIDTIDDVVTSFRTKPFGSRDPEGITFDIDHRDLFLIDGEGAEVYRISPGRNKVFDGVPPDGDDQVESFDVKVHGMTDPEGIAFDPRGNRLFIVGLPSGLMIEMKANGEFVRSIDISVANALKPAGATIGPSSSERNQTSIYIVDRGVDNDSDPSENDGKLYELSLDCEKVHEQEPHGRGDDQVYPESDDDKDGQSHGDHDSDGGVDNDISDEGSPESDNDGSGQSSGGSDEQNPPGGDDNQDSTPETEDDENGESGEDEDQAQPGGFGDDADEEPGE